MNTRSKPSSMPAPQVLDARSLGRPVHLLGDFATHLQAQLNELLRELLNRRYRGAGYELGALSIEPPGVALPTGAWWQAHSGDSGQGALACQLSRGFVLSVMAYRYGAGQGAAVDAELAETSTEERLVRLLAEQLLQGLARRLGAVELQAPLRQTPAVDAWLIRLPLREPQHGLETTLHLAIDPAWMNQLLREQGASTRKTRKPAAPLPPAQELPELLKLKLVARLAQTELPLGELLALQPGQVLPLSLKATEVLVDGSRLFTASVAEHQGKLCLTSFADAF